MEYPRLFDVEDEEISTQNTPLIWCGLGKDVYGVIPTPTGKVHYQDIVYDDRGVCGAITARIWKSPTKVAVHERKQKTDKDCGWEKYVVVKCSKNTKTET